LIIVPLKDGTAQIMVAALTNQNFIQEEIKSGLKLGNACHHLAQNLFSSSLLSKNLKACRNIILLVVLYGFETWLLTFREERRLRMFEDRVLRRIFGPRLDEITGEWRKLHHEELSVPYSSSNIVRVIKSRRLRRTVHVGRMNDRRGVNRVWVETVKDRDHLEDPGVDVEIILRWIFRKWVVGAWTGSSWLRIGTGGGRL